MSHFDKEADFEQAMITALQSYAVLCDRAGSDSELGGYSF